MARLTTSDQPLDQPHGKKERGLDIILKNCHAMNDRIRNIRTRVGHIHSRLHGPSNEEVGPVSEQPSPTGIIVEFASTLEDTTNMIGDIETTIENIERTV